MTREEYVAEQSAVLDRLRGEALAGVAAFLASDEKREADRKLGRAWARVQEEVFFSVIRGEVD